MNEESHSPYRIESAKGLPPVTPPSGKFIAQLFLVPLMIVAGIALVFFGVIWMFGDVFGGLGGARTPAQFLERIDKTNPDQRWRAASDLAQVLLRDDKLASNPRFALDLCDRLRKAMDAAAPTEKAIAERLQKHPYLIERLSKLVQHQPDSDRNSSDAEWKALEADWKRLEPDLNYIMYLSACLGNFMLPTGAPLLSELAIQEGEAINITETLKRRRAVWALANLGENLKRFDRLPTDQQEAVFASLEEEARGRSGARAELAAETLEHLTDRRAGRLQTMGVAEALVRCAEFGYRREDKRDPFLREIAAFAMGFWPGTPEENKMMDDALLALTQDDGYGNVTLAALFLNSEDQESQTQFVTRDPGKRIQYNAAAALARRGSERTRLDMIEDMLDEDYQLQQNRLRRKDGTEVADEATALLTMRAALGAVAELHKQRPDMLANRPSILEAVDKLTHSKYRDIQVEAERTRLALRPNS